MTDQPPSMQEATKLLSELTTGQRDDPSKLTSMMYEEMRTLAKKMMASERANHTLQPTALVHEVFLRLINASGLDIQSEDHFFLLAARVMRRVLIDHARSSHRLKRGGNNHQVPLTVVSPEFEGPINPADLMAIDEALERLRELDERKAKVVELRFFGGLDEAVTARILGIARSTASSDWRFARAWLLNELSNDTQIGK